MACQTLVETLEAVDGLELYSEVHQCPEPKGAIIAVHDYGEHSGVYRELYSRLCQEGYTVYANDLRGHGKSPGERGLITRFDDYLEDLDLLVARIKDREQGLPVFLLGQGLGALIAACFAFSRRPNMKGLILCGMVMDLPMTSMDRLIARYAGLLFARSHASQQLRDALLKPALQEDTLALRGAIRAPTIRELLGACKAVQANDAQLSFAILLIHAEGAVTSQAAKLEIWLERIVAVDKTVLRYQGQDQNVLLHKERDQVLGDILEWCDLHRSDQRQAVDEDEEWDELENDAL
jgi:acylglycerol lipase